MKHLSGLWLIILGASGLHDIYAAVRVPFEHMSIANNNWTLIWVVICLCGYAMCLGIKELIAANKGE